MALLNESLENVEEALNESNAGAAFFNGVANVAQNIANKGLVGGTIQSVKDGVKSGLNKVAGAAKNKEMQSASTAGQSKSTDVQSLINNVSDKTTAAQALQSLIQLMQKDQEAGFDFGVLK